MKKKTGKKNTDKQEAQKKVTLTDFMEKLQAIADIILVAVGRLPDEKLLQSVEADRIEWFERLYDLRKKIYDSDNPDGEFLANAVETVIEDAAKRIEEMKRAAAERSPEIARRIKPPEFEMPDWYNEALQKFMNAVEQREEILKKLKLMTPAQRREFQNIVSEFDAAAEEGEAAFAERYERYQKYKRWEDGLRQLLKTGSKKELAQLRQHLKKNPTHNGVMERMLREEFPE
ncbi:MAG TPA: hypothetical protein PKY59_15510 [Pyrinomonadaceae bacterium]|nr:hypothetical protein [Pyrinomonadaceae bacterium]